MQLETKKKQGTVTAGQIFSYDQSYKGALEYFNGDELAARVWVSKYALKDSYGNIYEKSPEQMHWRIAKEIARIEKRYPKPMSEEEVFELLNEFRYIVPQGSPMAGIGNKYQIASLSNCFVIGHEHPADSYGGILKMDQEQVQLMKRRGGVGHDLSHLRPRGSAVLNSALTSTGVVPFMERYSNSTREVAQDGRRGALMLTISVKHPDAEGFIDAKMEKGKVTGANVSVKIDNEFMRAVENNTTYVQQFPVDAKEPQVTREVNAREVWKKIVHNAWSSAEPGIIFWDTVTGESVADSYADQGFQTVSTNPCGEIPLCPYDSCRLLAINLYSYVDEPFTANARFNFEKFKKHAGKAQRIMDDIIDLEVEKIDAILAKIDADPEDEEIKATERNLWGKIRKKAFQGRRTGVGITAEGDMLAALNLRYGSDNAIDFSEQVHQTLTIEAYRESVEMAEQRGAFEVFDFNKEKDNPLINRIKSIEPEFIGKMETHGRRNISLLTIAPTGSTSLMTQTSSGIEPVFMPYYKRRRKVNPNDSDVKVAYVDDVGDSWEEYPVFHHHFVTWLTQQGYNVDEVKQMQEDKIQEIVQQSPYYKATSNDVDWRKKVEMQGRIQKWVDHSISVTINLPNEVSEDLVGQLYVDAWKHGCKGVTVYRDGSRSGVLINDDSKKKEKQNQNQNQSGASRKRPKILDADIVRFQNNKEKWVAFIGLKDDQPYEIFTGMIDDEILPIPKSINRGKIIKTKDEEGNKRYDFQYENRLGLKVTMEGLSYKFNPEYWNYAKLISGVLRQGMSITKAVHLIQSLHLDSEAINTWKNGVERALKRYIPDGTEAQGEVCEDCGSTNLIYQEGCLICQSCGSSRCG